MAVPRSRLAALTLKQCTLFSSTYNPTRARTGNKILRQRLIGPSVEAYYPRRVATYKDLTQAYKKYGLETWDDDEEDRLEGLGFAKQRGKGAPKKKRTKEESKKFNKGKKRVAPAT